MTSSPVVVITLVFLFAGSVAAQTQPPNCPQLVNIPSICDPTPDCSGLVCTSTLTATLTVHKCSDPLQVTLGLSGYDSVSFNAGGPEEATYDSIIGGFVVTAHLRRNATHLFVTVTERAQGQSGSDSTVVPYVEFPLDPHTCMCQSLDNLANNIQLPSSQFEYSCGAGPECLDILCNITVQGTAVSGQLFSVDPCAEALVLNNTIPGLGVDKIVFTKTESKLYSAAGFNFTIHVVLEHNNYSMVVQVALDIIGINYTVVPLNTINLDRSMCSEDLTYYPGTSVPTQEPPTKETPSMATPSVVTPIIYTPDEPSGSSTTGGSPVTTVSTMSTTTEGQPQTGSPTTSSSGCPLPIGPGVLCHPKPGCSGFTCDATYGSLTADVVVDKCSDPVTIDLIVTQTDSPSSVLFQGRYFAGGPQKRSSYFSIDQFTTITASYNRNTTHLNISVFAIVEGDIALQLVPDVEFPLDSHTCMCQSMNSLANEVNLPGAAQVGQLQYSCGVSTDCYGVVCNITAQSVTVASVQFTVDPCSEVLSLKGGSPSSGSQNFVVFNETESRPFTQGGTSVTVDVILEHHNYSVDIQMVFEASTQKVTVIPLSTIVLDRSLCGLDQLLYYPGDPLPPILPNSTTTSPTTLPPTSTTIPQTGVSGPTIAIIAVVITLCIVMGLIVVVVVVVVATFVVKKRKRASGGYSFRQLTDVKDDNDEPEM